MKWIIRLLLAGSLLMGGFVVERAYMARWRDAPVASDGAGRRRQRALAEVVSVQPAVPALESAGAAPVNPGRGTPPLMLQPCAARLLTGGCRGRHALFMNPLDARPWMELPVRPGHLMMLDVTVEKGCIRDAAAFPPPQRWRVLVRILAGLFAAMALLLGRDGFRAFLLVAVAVFSLLGVGVPLIVATSWPVAALSVSFVAICLATLLLWGGGWRAGLCAAAGASAGLAAGGMVAFGACRLAGLTGEASAVIRLLRQRPALSGIDFGGLLAAGMVAVAMGAAVDVAVTVVSALIEFRRMRPDASERQTFGAGMAVNRDVAGAMVLTVVLASLAMRLPVLMVFIQGKAVGEAWLRCAVAEGVQLAAACMAILLAGPCSAWLFARCRRLRVPPQSLGPARGRRWVQAAAAMALFAATLAAHQWLRPPEAVSELNMKDVAAQTSVPRLREWAAQWAELERWDEATLLLWRARRVAPGAAWVHRDLAYAYLARRHFAAAAAELALCADVLTDDALTHYVAGVLALWRNEVEKARTALGRALELQPHLDVARDALHSLEPPAP